MINFLLGMLTMYVITGILAVISETFGDGFLDSWFFYLFTWWIVVLCLPISLYLKIKRNKKSKRA